jgi:hypothetical protein
VGCNLAKMVGSPVVCPRGPQIKSKCSNCDLLPNQGKSFKCLHLLCNRPYSYACNLKILTVKFNSQLIWTVKILIYIKQSHLVNKIPISCPNIHVAWMPFQRLIFNEMFIINIKLIQSNPDNRTSSVFEQPFSLNRTSFIYPLSGLRISDLIE